MKTDVMYFCFQFQGDNIKNIRMSDRGRIRRTPTSLRERREPDGTYRVTPRSLKFLYVDDKLVFKF